MSGQRCEWTGDFKGVTGGCKHRKGHEDPNGRGPYMHEVTCTTCAGMVQDPFPEPGIRCIKHGTREPDPTASGALDG